MKIPVSFAVLLILFGSCKHENTISPQPVGTVAFSLSQQSINSGRQKETPAPASALLSIMDSKGIAQGNLKLSLNTFGQSFLTESLSLQSGAYQLTSFVIMDANNNAIYAAPLMGSDRAKYVTQPLPLDFTITGGQQTQVTPQVLLVTENDQPESFGLASFGFEVVKVGVVSINLNGAEKVSHVSYQFFNETKTISSDIANPGTILDINIPELLGKTWQSRIIIWTESGECFQKVYRYSNDLTFDGSIIQLPSLENENWMPFYYTQKDIVGIFRPVDPRISSLVELQLPAGTNGYGYVDREFYTQSGDALCDNLYGELKNADANGLIKTSIPFPVCDLGSLGIMDSFFSIIVSTKKDPISNLFYWEVKNGNVTPLCNLESKNGGRLRNIH